MKAKWVWKNGENNENTWLCFVKKISLDTAPCSCVAKIATDSKYWLYINGKCVVFEGGLKRGPSKNETYYDEVDISEFLTAGENTIAALVWYFGKNGFSHLSSGMGGFLFEADVNGISICSDNTWKVIKHPSYVDADENDDKANFRLSESNIYFDASKDLGKWYAHDYDISEWENADIICHAGEGAYGGLCKRIIPQLKDYGLKDYINSADYEGFTATDETVLKMKLPYNAQITPYLKITAPPGKRIGIKSDTYDDLEWETKSIMAVYYTGDGTQEYESLGWINGEEIYYTVPAGVTIHSLKYRETGYDTEFAGCFECDDEFLNKLWQKSLRTLYITMRDNFMDCPDRERTQWWGDVNVEMQMMMYCLDEKALLLYQKGVDTMAGWAEDNGYMLTVVPSVTANFELPFQNLAGIWGFWYYYEYTGDRSVPERAYEASKRYLLSYDMNPDGLVIHRQGSWDWPDWGDNSDIAPMENAWYYMALKSCKSMAELLGYDADIVLYNERMMSIAANYNRVFWKNGYYYDNTTNGKPDDRANALAVLSGLADKSRYDEILKVLKTAENSSPYMEKYVLDAICEMGYIDAAMERIKRRYREMVDYDYSTLWEYWSKDGTLNHAWSGGPLITMSKYIAGIRPIDTAYKTFEIKPHMCGLKHIKCAVPSVKGMILLDIEKTAERVKMSVTIPENTIAEVYLPLVNNMPPETCEHEFTVTDGYAKFIFSAGNYEL
ncbi:MAG: hypothetical protein J1G06_00745 [Oscillospiraceae bacterium]|nr:hypothetical protein [Oscillospiraceae bacterium]